MLMKHWWYIEAWIPFYGGRRYIGRAFTTREELITAFPKYRIEPGNTFVILARPK